MDFLPYFLDTKDNINARICTQVTTWLGLLSNEHLDQWLELHLEIQDSITYTYLDLVLTNTRVAINPGEWQDHKLASQCLFFV